MARGRGPLVFFRSVRLGPAKPQPYLKPGLKVGRRVMLKALQSAVATLRSTNPRTVRQAMSKAARIGGFATLAAAQKEAPKDTGRLRSSLNLREVSAFQYTVGTNLSYARPVEEGRKGGKLIEPVRAKALAFRWRNAPPGVRSRSRSRGTRR